MPPCPGEVYLRRPVPDACSIDRGGDRARPAPRGAALRLGGGSERLRQVSWEEWFETFDARRLNFLYQEQRSDGRQSNFFRLESPQREDA